MFISLGFNNYFRLPDLCGFTYNTTSNIIFSVGKKGGEYGEKITETCGSMFTQPFHGLDGECRDQRGKYIFPEREIGRASCRERV